MGIEINTEKKTIKILSGTKLSDLLQIMMDFPMCATYIIETTVITNWGVNNWDWVQPYTSTPQWGTITCGTGLNITSNLNK